MTEKEKIENEIFQFLRDNFERLWPAKKSCNIKRMTPADMRRLGELIEKSKTGLNTEEAATLRQLEERFDNDRLARDMVGKAHRGDDGKIYTDWEARRSRQIILVRNRQMKQLEKELVEARKRKDDANECLEEILQKRVPVFSSIYKKLNKDEASLFMRLFSATMEMVGSTVFILEDIAQTAKISGKLFPEKVIVRKKIRQKRNIARWRLSYLSEIAKETGTSIANISQRRQNLFGKYKEIGVFYKATEKAFNEAYEKARLFEAKQDSISNFFLKNKEGAVYEAPRLNALSVREHEDNLFQIRHGQS